MAFGLIALVLTRQGLAVVELLKPVSGTQAGLMARLADSAQRGTLAADALDSDFRAPSDECLQQVAPLWPQHLGGGPCRGRVDSSCQIGAPPAQGTDRDPTSGQTSGS